jgi:hypothetical protein
MQRTVALILSLSKDAPSRCKPYRPGANSAAWGDRPRDYTDSHNEAVRR